MRRDGGFAPWRIVMSRSLDLPEEANLWDVSGAPTVVMTQRGARRGFQALLRSKGVEVGHGGLTKVRPGLDLGLGRCVCLPRRAQRAGNMCRPIPAPLHCAPNSPLLPSTPLCHWQVVEFDFLTPEAVADYCYERGFLQVGGFTAGVEKQGFGPGLGPGFGVRLVCHTLPPHPGCRRAIATSPASCRWGVEAGFKGRGQA